MFTLQIYKNLENDKQILSIACPLYDKYSIVIPGHWEFVFWHDTLDIVNENPPPLIAIIIEERGEEDRKAIAFIYDNQTAKIINEKGTIVDEIPELTF